MTNMQPLPSYENPPVVEVALSVQFEGLQTLRTPELGLFWQGLRDRFPKLEEHPPLDSVIEQFGKLPRPGRPPVRFPVLSGLPAPRCWFLNEAGTELLQVQSNRLIHNWRKATGQEAYPRYEQLRRTFLGELQAFSAFVERQGHGTLSINQCEVSYVNHIAAGQGWAEFGELGKVLTVVNASPSESFLGRPEDVKIALRYVIPDEQRVPVGRLHVSVEPAYRVLDDCPLLVMNLTARGRPEGPGVEEAMRFLEIGREWIVRGFTTVTTPEMHKIWRRNDGV